MGRYGEIACLLGVGELLPPPVEDLRDEIARDHPRLAEAAAGPAGGGGGGGVGGGENLERGVLGGDEGASERGEAGGDRRVQRLEVVELVELGRLLACEKTENTRPRGR